MKTAIEFASLVTNAHCLKYHSKLHCVGAIVFDLISCEVVYLDDRNRLCARPADASGLTPAEQSVYGIISKSKPKTMSAIIAEVYLEIKSKAIFRKILDDGSEDLNVEEFRSEVLECGDLTEEAAVLLLLLKQSRCLNFYFSKHEQVELRAALKRVAAMEDKKIFSQIRRAITLLDILTWS